MKYSLIIPVYNRPDELKELLESLEKQTFVDFEVIVVEDGSSISAQEVFNQFKERISVRYFYQTNTGPALARNFGAKQAKGDYLLILDSDCIAPPTYLEEVEKAILSTSCDAFGGPDRAHQSFTPIQKAINYAMTSFLTTGGIRGGTKKLDRFYPRSFNMGVKKTVYEALGGFSAMRFGEDVDFSMRIHKAGYACLLAPQAWVFHKRRVSFRSFFKQVFNSGVARINLHQRHPGSLKLVHTFPTLFLVGVILSLLSLFFSTYAISPLLLYTCVVCIDSTIQNRDLWVGLLTIPASFIQLMGYGSGFLWGVWRVICLKKTEKGAFQSSFYD